MTVSAGLYVGPKVQKRLDAAAPNLSLAVDYGILWWLSVPLRPHSPRAGHRANVGRRASPPDDGLPAPALVNTRIGRYLRA